ncbi:MAG TPA: hypothetical protein VK431_04580 [Nitrosopumilaceae archaeon]|nr:hypothetical protein [Nitrosopumilaceae archaeon]
MFSTRRNNRRAISAVLTTIIILVASIVLGTGVVVYSTSLFQTGGQQQSIQVQGVKGWVNSTAQNGVYYAWGAAAVRNSGDKILSVDSIQMRGATIPFTNWYADTNTTRVNSGSNFQAQFNLTKTDQNGNPIGTAAAGGFITSGLPATCVQSTRGVLPYTTLIIDEDTGGSSLPLCLAQQAGPISLNPGAATIIYYKVPIGVFTGLDSGAITTASIFAGKVGAPQSIRIANP